MRGAFAGTALLAHASAWSAACGAGGAVALQAENPRAAAFYERLGFRRMTPADDPLSVVPRGERGWSPEIQRVALGRPGAEEARSPWLVLGPRQVQAEAASAARALTGGARVPA